jgi:DmsE family decaheme c-type cytochrome
MTRSTIHGADGHATCAPCTGRFKHTDITSSRLSAPMLMAIWLLTLLLSPVGMAQTPEAATYVGEKVCTACHSQENRHFTETLHAKAFRLNPRNENEARVCEACHGPGSLHVKDTKNKSALIGFTKHWDTPVARQNQQCQGCHTGGSQIHWTGSMHARNQLSCADCHNPMERNSASGLLARTTINDTCESCHQQQRNEFNKRSHMPLHEGKMTCVDCHNPHGSATRPLLKAESTNVVCYACHAEKRGPFLWEHQPVRDNCTNCHAVHGSNHDKLLVAERPFLCQQCHNLSVGHSSQLYRADQTAAAGQLTGGATNPRVPGRACQNCHTQIHGSNHPAGARFQR